MKRLPAKRDEPPSRPITFRAAEDLGALELARLWADSSAWALTNRTQYDELAELAVMSALAAWLRRWQPIAIHGAILAGARPEAVAGAFGDSVEVAFERWREWAVIQRDNIIGSKPGIDAEEYDTVARRFTARPGPAPRLYPAEPGTGPGHQLIEYPRPAARVYAGASGQQKIIMSRHKPG